MAVRFEAVDANMEAERRARACAAAASLIAGAWTAFGLFARTHPEAGHHASVVFVLLSANASLGLGARALRRATTRVNPYRGSFFLVAIVPLLSVRPFSFLLATSAVVYGTLVVAGFLLERRRLEAAPGINLRRSTHVSPLSVEACEERLR